MRKIALPGTILAGIFAVILQAAPAHAQATRTWVSGVGDDANPCSRTAPCKTFAGAISKTATNGEINCLDSAGYGALTITKSISVICEGVVGGVLVSGTNGIIVNNTVAATTIKVVLRGLDFEGLNTGLNGVHIIGTGVAKVTVDNTRIRNFSGNGVNIAGPVGNRVLITNSLITGNGGGVNVGAPNVGNVAVLDRTTVDNNTNFAVQVANTSTVFLSGSKLLGSASALTLAAGAVASSFGDNSLTGSGLPTTTPGNK